jgi:hypothetical protein
MQLNRDLLQTLKARILASPGSLCNFYGNCEAEVMVSQTIIAACKHLEQYGEPFSFRSPRVFSASRMGVIDNGSAYRCLVEDRMFDEKIRHQTAFRELPEGVTEPNGEVTIIFPTPMLLQRLATHFGIVLDGITSPESS